MKIISSETLSCWKWKHGDGSGHLESPTGKAFFSYDLAPYHYQGGIEFKIDSSKQWEIFWGPFQEFKLFAEKKAHEIFKVNMLQQIPEDVFKPNEPEWADNSNNLISWYVPVLFSADDTFEGIHVNTDENNDWINIYALYRVKTDETVLMLVYDGDEFCWDALIEMEEKTKTMVERIIKEKAKAFIKMESESEE